MTRPILTQELIASSHDLGPTGRDQWTGYGFLDTYEALRAAMGLPPA